MKLEPNPDLSYIKLSIGDPTIYGNFPPHKIISESIVQEINSGKANGYCPAHGTVDARKAVAKYCSIENKPMLTENDVFITNGASGALEISLLTVASEKRTVLLPRPGFALYKTLL